MKFYTYEEYECMDMSISVEEMSRLHREMLMEIGDDECALELYEELIKKVNKYSTFRADWWVWSREERMEKDSSRTICHEAVIVKFNQLARYLKQQKKTATWREVLGDEKEHLYNRKRIGDFACYIFFVNGLCAR